MLFGRVTPRRSLWKKQLAYGYSPGGDGKTESGTPSWLRGWGTVAACVVSVIGMWALVRPAIEYARGQSNPAAHAVDTKSTIGHYWALDGRRLPPRVKRKLKSHWEVVNHVHRK